MKLNPPEAPLYGECLLTVQLSEEECAEGEEDVEFYLLFSGTTQRHLTTTLRVSHVTLQAVCPAHNRGETVQVKLCQARPGGAIDLVAEEHFQFVQDLALDMAHFLVRAAAHKGGLRGAMLLDECQIPLQECERLDETLTLALKHLPLPKGWSVLGTDITTQLNTERGPHDTLLHFAARQGLRRVALFLLQQPGGRDALRFTNKQGHTPAQLAQKRGHSRLQHLLTDFENSSCSEEKPSRRCFPGGRALIHHPVLNTYTLTVDSDPGAPPPDLRADVEELQRLIGSHCREKACCVGPAPLHTLGLEPKEEKCSHSTHSSDGWPCPSGAVETVQSEEGAAEGGGDQAAEGVCVGTPQECVALGTISCTEQRLEEADKVLGVVRGEQESSHLRPSQKRPLANHSGAQSQTRSTAQSDCGGEGAMGQSHGVLPTETPQRREGEVGWRMGDLPGREGEEPSSLSAPHIGSSEDGTWVENSERSDMPADSDQGNAQAGREIVQPSESREDPGSHSAQTEAPGSAQLDPEMEESDAASLQTTMVPGPDFDAHRGTASEGGASHDHPQNSSRTEPAPLSVEHASTTGKTALCDEIAKGEVDGFLNEEHRQNLDASKPALVISVPTGEETRNDATPIGQTPSDRDRKSPDDGEVSSPETEPVTGSESQPMTCSTSPPVAGETPSAPSESELPQESRVMNPVEQKPDEPPRPPTALDPTQDHTPSGGHGSQTQEAAAAGPPGSEAPSPHQPLEIEETREECEKLPAASAEGCEGTEPSAPPPPPCGLDCQDDSSETSLDPQTEITTSSVTSGAAPVQIETVVSSDSSMTLDRTSTSDPLNFSEVLDPTSPLDIESGTAMYLAISSPVEVDGGLAQEINCGGPETQSREEPHQEQLTGQPSDSVSAVGGDPQGSLKHTDPSEVRRGPEAFCPVGEVCSPVLTEQPGTDLSPEEMCLCVSVNSLPALDSVSDGDSLLGPETDDSVFKQIEDTITLAGDSTSGISLTGSISTDNSSAGDTPPVGGAEEGEKQDCLMEVPECSVIVRTSARALSPTRRHSWEANRNSARESDMDQRSVVQNLEEMKSAGHRRSMSWCPSDVHRPETDEMNARSYSLEGLSDEREGEGSSMLGSASPREPSCPSRLANEERGSLVSLTEEDQEEDLGDASSVDSQRSAQGGWCSGPPAPLNLTKSVSMSAISPRDLDDSLMPLSGTLESSISEEEPGPLRSDSEARVGVTKVSRTFSYLKSKMSKKNKEKDREKNKDGKEKEKWSTNGHIFSPASTPPHLFSPASTPPPIPCLQCNKPVNNKDALLCTNCNAHVHKNCREGLPVCTKVKTKQQSTVCDSSSAPGIRNKDATPRERPWSTEDQAPPSAPPPRKSSGIMALNGSPLSKSISISNIAGQLDDSPLKALKFLSQSTDSLNKGHKVAESTESLTDEGAELMDSQLLGEFEADTRELEADSWSLTVDKKYLKQLKKDVVKRQDVIYELIQTEMHHVRTLRIMADVYSKGLQKEVQLDAHTVEKLFPMLEDLLDVHTNFFTHLLERKREARSRSPDEGGFVIRRIGDILLAQVTGSSADRMKRIYGKFCSRHNEAVNLYKELHTKDKRFQTFIKKKMCSSVVRRLSIPECILLVTQRITKYPVLLQRLLQHTRDPEEEHADVAEALRQVKEVIAAVDTKVSDHEKKKRLKEVYNRTDSKSITRMKSGQMFAREDLIRGRSLLYDGTLQLKTAVGRLKDVQALLLSDVFVFLQEKDQKYIFASLDQRSTVVSLQKLIVREVANEERGLFLISAGTEIPEMVEVHASSKEERNTWIQLIQNAMTSIEKEDDEGIPSENEEDKRLQENRNREIRDQLQRKDEQILALLEEKMRLFRDLCDCPAADGAADQNRTLFRATRDVTKGESVMKEALKEVEVLQALVNSMLGTQQDSGVCVAPALPHRAETFAGFHSHQMNISKNGEAVDESADLRRTESDGGLKKGGSANLLLPKRNREQVHQSVSHLYDLLNTLQAVVVQQDSLIEEQRQTLRERLQVPSSSSSSSRPGSLIEQEKQRSLERHRQEAASLQRQRAAHSEERRRRESQWEERERELALREEQLHVLEQETRRKSTELEEEVQDLRTRKEEYQRDLARLRDNQRRLERDREQLDTEEQLEWRHRNPPTTPDSPLKSVVDATEPAELSSSPPTRDLLSRMDSKRKGKTLNPFVATSGQKGGAAELQGASRLLQLTKPKPKKEKKKKKGQAVVMSDQSTDGQVFFC